MHQAEDKRRIGVMLQSLAVVDAAFAAALPADQPQVELPRPAPGWSELGFEAPAPGSYQLPVLGLAGDGRVVDSHAGDTTLHALMGDGIVVLSFIYSSCSDTNGCPLATHVLARLKAKLRESPQGTHQLRFLSLSFDPAHDTPEVMRRYGDPFSDEYLDWRFLTTRQQSDLAPILESYGQSIVRDPGVTDADARSISHLLRVYLVDPQLRIRNIYSASYLHAEDR